MDKIKPILVLRPATLEDEKAIKNLIYTHPHNILMDYNVMIIPAEVDVDISICEAKLTP